MTSQDAKAVWSDSVDHEIAYWDRTMKKNAGAFQARFRRARPANELLPGLVDLIVADRVSILDVGCGPAPVVLGAYDKPVEITTCDPLADLYRELFERHGIEPSVDLVNCEGEALVERFGADRFHIVHIQNALDHTYHPAEVVQNMLACTAPGGVVVIKTLIETGKFESYHGLHQWDILPAGGDFYIRHRDGETTAMRELLGDRADLLLSGVHVGRTGTATQNWLNVVIVKPGGSPTQTAAIERHFFDTMVKLGLDLAQENTHALAAANRTAQENAGRTATADRTAQQLAVEVEELKARLEAVRASTSFQLGRALVEARRPSNLIRFPGRVIALARGRARATQPQS